MGSGTTLRPKQAEGCTTDRLLLLDGGVGAAHPPPLLRHLRLDGAPLRRHDAHPLLLRLDLRDDDSHSCCAPNTAHGAMTWQLPTHVCVTPGHVGAGGQQRFSYGTRVELLR